MRNCYVLTSTTDPQEAERKVVCVYGYKPSVTQIVADARIGAGAAKELIEIGNVTVAGGNAVDYALVRSTLYE